MRNILVLMSTYNGEKYLKEQIDSILAQKNVEVTIRVRDDGSTEVRFVFWKNTKNAANLIGTLAQIWDRQNHSWIWYITHR